MDKEKEYQLFKSQCQSIVDDAKRRKEKVIAVDSETFEEKKGKIIQIRITSGLLEEIEKILNVEK